MVAGWQKKSLLLVVLALLAAGVTGRLLADDEEVAVERTYVKTPDAPRGQSQEDADAKSAGCISCHTKSDAPSMHDNVAVVLGCADCHGGDATVKAPEGLAATDPRYASLRDKAHVLPRYPQDWNYPHSANPKESYTLLNKEAPEYVRFVNPSDYRVARQSCGACHLPEIQAAERSLMSTGAMFFEGGAYNNGVLPLKGAYKNVYGLDGVGVGEAYTPDGKPAKVLSPGSPPGTITEAQIKRGAQAALIPLPTWQVMPPSDIFRVFERGGRTIGTEFPEIGLPDSTGDIQKLEEPGRPDIKQSNRGPGTGLRVAIAVLNLHKTRLNDPFMWFMGTNDQPGDYRQSGCAGCHVIYANSREPRESLTYAQFGRDGKSQTVDPTIPKDEPGHPLKHVFTRSIPTSQCMNCHMHQPNMFLNTYLGYTMWDYEADAPFMWPKEQKYPTIAEEHKILERNPEGASPRGNWADLDFLRNVYDLNPKLHDTQFADYHGHGWNFRAIFKRDRDGNLLDKDGKIVSNDDPEKWRKKGVGKFGPIGQQAGKAVHMMDIHAEKGMQCSDCHFAQDSHGSGLIMGEVANAVEIGCKDCHGTVGAYPTLKTSGPAAPPGGTDLAQLRNQDGSRRFEWVEENGRRVLYQRSSLDSSLRWKIILVKDSVDPTSPDYDERAARAKLMSRTTADGKQMQWGPGVEAKNLAHKDSEMACFSCHTAWTTSCGGCHLPIESNWKTDSHKYEGQTTRNFATYNPQVARDQMFQLGIHSTVKGNEIAPVRSSSALVLSSTNINRDRIYVQQPPISAAGFSAQAFAPHFPHTVRTTETKTCDDCHLSVANDNNAIMAQLMLLGTNFVNFVGLNAWTGLEGGIEAIRVTEWSEPQAVFGSYLQKYAYPDYYKAHVERNHRELIDWRRGDLFGKGDTNVEDIYNVKHSTDGAVRCIQLRGEYLYTADGPGGFRVFDVASIANKDISQKIITAPFSPLGQQMHVASKNATCMAIPTDQSIAPLRNTPEIRKYNQEQAFHPIYHYAFITDAEEGLILVDVDTLSDRDPRNNNLSRALTWNPNGVLNGASHITLAGYYAYIATPRGLVVVNLDDPLKPKVAAQVALPDMRASAVQFRYLFVTDARGLEVLDITKMDQPRLVEGARLPLDDARRVYVARTYAYIAAGKDGLVIADVKNPEKPRLYWKKPFENADSQDVIVGTTNASLFAYVADGKNGLKVLQLTSPESQPNFYGFSPPPKPEVIAWAKTPTPALALSKGLDRDRAVDETGNQIAIFGRLGSRPFHRDEMEKFFIDWKGQQYRVSDDVLKADFVDRPDAAKPPAQADQAPAKSSAPPRRDVTAQPPPRKKIAAN